MGAAHKCLNLTMLSAQGLKDVCTFGTMSPYAKVWIHPSAKQRTPVATNAGCTPVWGHKIHLSLPHNALREDKPREKLSLTIQIWNQGSASDTLVGSSNLPLCDLLSSTKPNGLEFMACQLTRPSGKVQGLVNFSVEISDNHRDHSNTSAPACTLSKESQENGKETSSSSTMAVGGTTKGDISDNELHQSRNTSTELKEPVKWSALTQSGKSGEAAPDALRTGHASSKSSDPQRTLYKPGTPVPRFLSAPDALDLPHGYAHSQRAGPSLGDHSNQQGDGPHSSDGGQGTRAPQNSLPGLGGGMLGGVLGALLLGEAVDERNGGSGQHYPGSVHGPGGSSEGVPQP